MTTSNQGVNTQAIDAVLVALDRLTGDLRHRTEEAERRAREAEERIDLEREARHVAETRAEVAEQAAKAVLSRADAIEKSARESLEQLRQELLTAIREATDVARATAAIIEAATIEAVIEPDRSSEARDEAPRREERDSDLSHIPVPTTGRVRASSEPAPRRWERQERGYAWVEDEPGPPWWRRIFGQRY